MMFIILNKSEFLAIVLPLHMAGVSYTHTHTQCKRISTSLGKLSLILEQKLITSQINAKCSAKYLVHLISSKLYNSSVISASLNPFYR